MAVTRTLAAPKSRLVTGGAAPVSPRLAPARAAAIPTTSRLGGSRLVAPSTTSAAPLRKLRPLSEIMAATKKKEKPRSLFQQATHLLAGVPRGVVQLGVNAAIDAVAPVHAAFDLVKDGHLRNIRTYLPATSGFVESMAHTGYRAIHPTQYLKAIREGRILDAIVEDVGNISIVAGGAAKALGAAGGATAVGLTAEEAAAATAKGGSVVRSVGSAVAEDLAEGAGKVRAPINPLENVAEAVRLKPPEMLYDVKMPHRGIARYLEKAGDLEGAERLQRAGEAIKKYGHKPARIFDPTLPYRLPGKLLEKVGYGEYAPGRLVGQGLRRAGERFIPDDIKFRSTEAGQKLSQILTSVHRAGVEAGSHAIDSAKQAEHYGLTTAQGRAIGLVLEQPGFLDSIRELRDMPDGDHRIAEILDNSPVWRNADSVRRPTVADVRAAWDYADRKLPVDVQGKMDLVRDSMGRQAELRKQVGLERGAFQPEQLEAELLPSKLNMERGALEQQAERIDRNRNDLAPSIERQQRIAATQQALADELPAPPDARQNFDLGQASAADATQRAAFEENQRQLRRAVDRYVALDAGAQAEAVAAAGAELDRLIERHGQLSERLGVQQRRVEAATGLSRAGYDVIPGEEVARPEVAGPAAGEAKGYRDRAEQFAARQSDDAYGQVENLTQGSRPSLPDKSNRHQGGEYDWWYHEIDEPTRRRLQSEGWFKGRTMTKRVRRTDPRTGRSKWVKVTSTERPTITTPDQFAQEMSARVGRELDPHEALNLYHDQIKRYWEAEGSHTSDAAIEAVAAETGAPIDQVRAAIKGKLSDYGELFTGTVDRTLNEVKGDYDALPPAERDSFNLSAEAMRADPEATLADFEDLLQSYFPGSDISGSQGVMSVLADNVDVPQMIDWLRGAELPETIRQRVEQRSSAQYRQLGRMQGDVNQSRAQLADVNQAQRQGRRLLNAAQRDVDKGLSAAAKDIDTLDARGAKLAPYEGEGPRLGELTPNGDPAWKRRTGTTNTGETTNPLSPAERQQARAAVEQRALSELEARDARLERSAQRVRAKKDNLETELNRSIQDRLVDDVNRPAIVSVRKVIRKMGEELGGITGRGPAITLTGLTKRLAAHYGFYDDALSILEGKRRDARGGIAAVDDLGGSPMPELPASTVNAVIEEIIERKQIVMEPEHRRALANSTFTDTLLEEMAQVLYEENAAGRRLNAPYRLLDLVEQQRAHLPPEIRVQLDNSVEMWRRRRVNMQARTFDTATSAMPAKYRTMAQRNRGLVSSLVDLAEKAHQEGDTATATIYQAMAEDTMNTMQQFVEAGIDPTHLVGGKEAGGVGPSTIGGGPSLSQRKVRASVARKGSLRPLSIGDYARLEAKEAQTYVNNGRNKLIEDTLGKEAQEIPEVRQAMNDWETIHGSELPPEDIAKAARDAGYVPIEPRANLTASSKLVPKEVLANLPDSFQPKGLFKALGKANQKWKTWVLPFSPKWHLGNLVGNMIMATVHGGIGPVELARTMREIVKDQGGLREMWQREGVPDWARRELAERGFTYTEHRILNQGTEQAARTPIGKVAAMSYKVNEFVDNMTRSAVDMAKIRQGMSSEAALKSTLKAMGDFSNLNNFERHYVRQVLPFYSWMRHSIAATLRLPIESPARAAVLLHLAQMYSDPEMANDLLGRIGSKIPLGPVDGIAKFLDLGTLSPLAEMNPMSGFPLDPTSIARSVSPFVKLPTAVLAGIDLNTMSALKRPSKAGTGPPIRKLFSDPLHGAGEIAYLAAGMAPAPIKALRELAPFSTTRGGPRYKLGYKVGKKLPPDPNSGVLGTVARGLNIPWTYKIRTDEKEGG